MSKVKRITKDCQPVFPCWLWDEACEHWSRRVAIDDRFTRLDLHNDRLTHWHPDQPTAPTERP